MYLETIHFVHGFALSSLSGVILIIVILTLIILAWGVQQLMLSWMILGLITFITFYFSPRIPVPEVWNPIIRELYPHRQWKPEQTITQTLHWLRLIPGSRITRDSTRLPAELWSIILDYTIEIPFLFDTACDAKNFNRFIHAQTCELYTYGYLDSEQERKSLRIVCKQWALLLDCRKMRWFRNGQKWYPSGTQILRADLQTSHIGENVNPRDHSPRLLESTIISPGQIISLTTLAIEQGSSVLVAEYFQEHIMPRAASLPNLRSIILGPEYSVPATLLLNIERSFSRLKFLRLEASQAFGPLRLDELEILYLDLMPADLVAWRFPSLIHLALGKKYLGDRPLDLDAIPTATEQLHSLLLLREHALILADDSFWIKLASLRFLGVMAQSFSIVDKPHPLHPLAHVCLSESYSFRTLGREKVPITALDFDHVSAVLRSVPNLRFVTMPTVADKDRYPSHWRVLFMAHLRMGVRWLDEEGVWIDAMKRTERVPRVWEAYLLVAAYVYCRVPLILAPKGYFAWTPELFIGIYVIPMLIVGMPYYLWTIYDH